MPLTIALFTLDALTDPNGIISLTPDVGSGSGQEWNDGTQAVLGSQISIDTSGVQSLTIDENTLEDDFNEGSGAAGNTLSEALTIGSTTYPAGSRVETDYSVVVQDAVTGYYYVLSHVSIDDVAIGASISRPFDLSANGGNGAIVSGEVYPSGNTLTTINPDTTSSSADWLAFVQDPTYNQGNPNGSSNDVDINGTWVGFQDPAEFTPPNYIVEGTAGDDTIDTNYTGDPEGDRVDNSDALDGSDDDLILGFGGNDDINAGAGDDTVSGGSGADTIESGAGADVVSGGAGDDIITNASGEDLIDGGTGDDTITGSSDNETLFGGSGDDRVLGGGGDDQIFGDQGDGGRYVGSLDAFDFSTASQSEVGDTGTGAIGAFAVYDNIGVSSDGTQLSAVL